MLSDAFLLFVTTVISGFITFVVCISPNVKRSIKFAFTFTTISLSLWSISIYIADSVRDNLLFWNDLAFFWPSIGALSCFVFVKLLNSSFDDARVVRRTYLPRWLPLVVLAMSAQFVAIASSRIFTKISYDTATHTYSFTRGIFYSVYISGLLLLLVLIFAQLIGGYRKSDNRSQARFALRSVMAAIIATALYSLLANVLIPVITGSQKFISFGAFSLDIFAFGLAYSIIKYHFLDIRRYAWLAAAYISSVLLVLIIYTSIVSVAVVKVLGVHLNTIAILVLAVTALGVAVSFHPLQLTTNKLTKRLFFRDYYETQDILDRISKVLVHSVNVKNIQEQTKAVIEDAFHPAFLQFLLNKGESHQKESLLQRLTHTDEDVIAAEELDSRPDSGLRRALSKQDIALVIRLSTSHDELGFLLFGYRKSGVGYSLADKRFLRVIADQLAIGLQNALHFEEIQKFNITLQDEVDAATRKLQRQNKRLEELDNIKDDFISMASHQLRTPLTSVKGYLSMVLEGDAGKLNDTQIQMLKQAFTSSQRMVFLITDLLNVSRLKTGKFIIDAQPTNLRDVVQQELEQLKETAQVKDIRLAYDKPKNFPALMLDEVKTRQVIMNFVDNAIYYTPQGGHIRVELVDNPSTVELKVVDDGIGVPRAEQHHLFTKFYRATNARKARPDGTGLGLFMAQKVITAQGGSVIFSSQENKGSTFGFVLSKARLSVQETSLKKNSQREPELVIHG